MDHKRFDTLSRLVGSRRVALASIAGLGLAASAWLSATGEDVEAREGAYDGEMGGRHGKDRRGREKHKHRSHSGKRGKGGSRPGAGGFSPACRKARSYNPERGITPDLSGLDLTECDLSWGNLNGVNLNHANLTRAKLTSAELRHAHLFEAILSGAILNDALVPFADLRGAKLNGASLIFTNLSSTDLTGADLSGAILRDTQWISTTCPDGTNSDDHGDTCVGHLG
jgi:hypothetical protein